MFEVNAVDGDKAGCLPAAANGQAADARAAHDPAGQPSRRQVLYGAGASLGLAALAPVLGRGNRPAGRVTARAAAGRSLDFGQDWKFVLVNPNGTNDPTGAYQNAYQPGFDDSGWQVLDVPHDWAIYLTPVDLPNTSSATGFLQTGLAWYRKHFTLPPSLAGQRISIEFDGIYMNPTVWLNGQLLGNHPYAYTGYNFDITGLVHTDGVTGNVLAVQVPSAQPSSRWYSGSGIFRNVYLVVTNPVHVARHGTFVTTPDLAANLQSGFAAVQIQTDVENDGSSPATVDVSLTITDPHGRPAGQGSATVSVPGGQAQSTVVTVNVTSPALWSTASPGRYSLATELSVGGTVVDATTATFGIRYVSFDPSSGLSLNGQPMKLQGVDLHATEGAIGSAVRYDALVRQMQIMQSMGVNALRTAHNPPAPELVEACEQLGILMMVEAFDCWHTGKLPYDYHLYFDQWSEYDIKEMVHAAKNSPAVVLWSIGNETPDTGLPDGPPIAQQLIGYIKSIDTTRPVVMGSDKYRSLPGAGSPEDQIVRMLDGLGVNYNTAMSMDALHQAYPDTPFFCSETSSEESCTGHRRRFPDDRRAPGAQQRAKDPLAQILAIAAGRGFADIALGRSWISPRWLVPAGAASSC
jgi:beta-galactosidase